MRSRIAMCKVGTGCNGRKFKSKRVKVTPENKDILGLESSSGVCGGIVAIPPGQSPSASCYGWPKNVLHWAGIDSATLDINAAVRPDFAIVDGIVGMEGNGPIQGEPKNAGVLILGDDPVAVDATCCRVMGLLPEKVKYLTQAGILLGHIHSDKIQQLGESIARVRTQFSVLDNFRHLVDRSAGFGTQLSVTG
jgi:hypothetical protein